jgi:hypothetical protein
MNALKAVNYPLMPFPRLRGSPQTVRRIARKLTPPLGQEQLREESLNATWATRVFPDRKMDLFTRQALQAYLEVLSLPDETQAHLWFSVDVYV